MSGNCGNYDEAFDHEHWRSKRRRDGLRLSGSCAHMADSASRSFSCAGVRMPEARCSCCNQHCRQNCGEEQQRHATGSGWTTVSHDFSFSSFELRFTTPAKHRRHARPFDRALDSRKIRGRGAKLIRRRQQSRMVFACRCRLRWTSPRGASRGRQTVAVAMIGRKRSKDGIQRSLLDSHAFEPQAY